jgi:hypothetical protein
MALPMNGYCRRARWLVMLAILAIPTVSIAADYKLFTSTEYDFAMKYPASWVKLDKPKGNYYVVFQSPDLMDNFRPRVHVAAHKPVKDSIKVFLQEFRNGIKDLKKKEVKIIDEGEFQCDVPGAYFFFIQALDDKLKIWMDIVIVFYKNQQTLLRISCLAPSKGMSKMQGLYNDVLVSVRFTSGQQPASTTSGAPSTTVPAPEPAATPEKPTVREATPPARIEQPRRPEPSAGTARPPAGPRPGPRSRCIVE